MNKPLQLIQASQFLQSGAEWSHCRWRLLAEGDSWFSLGAINPVTSANLLQSLAFSEFAAAVHCAYPGDTLRRMTDLRKDPNFVQLLTGKVSWRWDAILLSAGGNDLIDAARSPSTASKELRLLLRADEWGPESDGAARYLSPAGWKTFSDYFRANLSLILALRDEKTGPNGNRGRPLCMHTYACPMPRPSGAGLGQGPWLLPAMEQYAIPQPDRGAVARLLVDRLAGLMLECGADNARFPALHVFDSRACPLEPAQSDSSGESGDWLNEIHLTRGGCGKVAGPWSAEIERIMLANP